MQIEAKKTVMKYIYRLTVSIILLYVVIALISNHTVEIDFVHANEQEKVKLKVYIDNIYQFDLECPPDSIPIEYCTFRLPIGKHNLRVESGLLPGHTWTTDFWVLSIDYFAFYSRIDHDISDSLIVEFERRFFKPIYIYTIFPGVQ